MSVLRLLRIIGSIAFVIAVIGAAYLGYRYWGVQKAYAASLVSDFSYMPAVICRSSDTGFATYSSATMYYARGAWRADALVSNRGVTGPYHVLITADKRFYSWDGSGTGITFDLAASSEEKDEFNVGDYLDLSVFGQKSCAPWWSVDASLFVPPDHTDFIDIAQ